MSEERIMLDSKTMEECLKESYSLNCNYKKKRQQWLCCNLIVNIRDS